MVPFSAEERRAASTELAKMSAAGLGYKQDMPPPGGYKDIYWKRTHVKTWFTAARGFGLYGVCFALGYWTIRSVRKRVRRMGLEENDLAIATSPFMMAERDRRVLRMWRQNRDLENELMKDVPGWKTGTYWGEPVFLTSPNQEEWFDMDIQEAMTHAPRWRKDMPVSIWNSNHLGAEKPYDKHMPEWFGDIFPGQERAYQGQKFGAESL